MNNFQRHGYFPFLCDRFVIKSIECSFFTFCDDCTHNNNMPKFICEKNVFLLMCLYIQAVIQPLTIPHQHTYVNVYTFIFYSCYRYVQAEYTSISLYYILTEVRSQRGTCDLIGYGISSPRSNDRTITSLFSWKRFAYNFCCCCNNCFFKMWLPCFSHILTSFKV